MGLRIQPSYSQVRNFSFSILSSPLLIGMWRPFLVFVLCLASASSIQWVKLDRPAEIKCSVSGEIQSCSWKTPKMERPRWNFTEERMYITTSGKDCIAHIEKTQKEDEGLWECLVSYHTADGFGGNEDKKKSVKIVEFPNNDPVIKAGQTGENDTETVYTCSYESKPLPNFSWSADGVEIPVEGATLSIEHAEYANQTLKCVVDFKKHGLNDTFEGQLLINQENISSFDEPEYTPEAMDTIDASTKTIIAILATVAFICLFVVILYCTGYLRNPPKSDNTDAETGTSDSLPMKESTGTEKSDDETEKADSTKDEKKKLTEAVKGTFGDRLASFFRINKSFNMDDEKTDNAGNTTNDDDLQKVVIDNTGDNKENGDDLDKPDSKTSLSTVSLATDKAECNGDDLTEEPVAAKAKKANGGNKLIAVFAKMFKPRSDAVADNSVPDEETLVKIPDEEQEQEQNKVEETEPLTDELEPEDKAEPVEKEDDKKEPTPNSSF